MAHSNTFQLRSVIKACALAFAVALALLAWLQWASNIAAAASPAAPNDCVAISPGQSISGTIELAGELDCVTFIGVSGDLVRARVVDTSGQLSSYHEIIGPNSQTICGPTLFADLNCQLLSSGTHIIQIRDFAGDKVGAYRLHLQQLNDPVGCVTLGYNTQPVTGTISLAGDSTCFFLNGLADKRIRTRVVRVSGNLSAYHEILRPSGTTLCGPTLFDELTCDLDTDGRQTILVYDFTSGTRTGKFLISVSCLSTPPCFKPSHFVFTPIVLK